MSSRADFLASLGISETEMSLSYLPDEPAMKKTVPSSKPSYTPNNKPSSFSYSSAACASSKATRSYDGDEDDADIYRPSSFQKTSFSSSHHKHDDSDDEQENVLPPPRGQPNVSTSSFSNSFNNSSALGRRSGSGLGFSQKSNASPPNPKAAEELKNLGNECFKSGDYRKAVRYYGQAIEKDPECAALYSNRSATYLLAQKQMGIDTRSMALRDAEHAISLKPDWAKAYGRKGDALYKMERYMEAAAAYEHGIQLEPTNTTIVEALQQCREKMAVHKGAHSFTAGATSSKSARELLEELHSTHTDTLTGGDYKEVEKERFRQRTSSSGELPKQAMLPPEAREMSRAAREYQQSLLEAYRKKKANQGK